MGMNKKAGLIGLLLTLSALAVGAGMACAHFYGSGDFQLGVLAVFVWSCLAALARRVYMAIRGLPPAEANRVALSSSTEDRLSE